MAAKKANATGRKSVKDRNKKRRTNRSPPPNMAIDATKGLFLPQPAAEIALCGDDAPPGYDQLLKALKARIRQSQIRAAVMASCELIRLYWDVGREIVQRQQRDGWGKAVVDRLAADIQREFPGTAGFSGRNVWRMRAFYLAYAPEAAILPQAVSELGESGPPGVLARIPWFHNVVLIEKVKPPLQRLWYAQKAAEYGWSRAVLAHQIELNLYGREGKAITNFQETLPPPQSDLAQQVLKDPYVFDFLTLTDAAREREWQRGLVEHLRDFMLELGVGFAFVGRRRPAPPRRRPAEHRHHPLQSPREGDRGIRLARHAQADRRLAVSSDPGPARRIGIQLPDHRTIGRRVAKTVAVDYKRGAL
jgi:predicted nuclease of restriction endonuclease-like (RecB) superfamily